MPKFINNQRGAALLMELVLAAAVLSLIGLAVYQSRHAASQQAAVQAPKTANTSVGVAQTTVDAAVLDATAESSISSEAESAADQAAAADSDVSNLGASFNANNF